MNSQLSSCQLQSVSRLLSQLEENVYQKEDEGEEESRAKKQGEKV